MRGIKGIGVSYDGLPIDPASLPEPGGLPAALSRDLAAVRRWVEQNTYCAIQSREGWYKDDCIESKARRKCERCRMLARLDKHLAVSHA